MFVVGQLTHIYNRGVDLAADLAALEAQKPLQKFGILERNLLYAEARLEDGSSANITTAATANKQGKSINSAAVMKSTHFTAQRSCRTIDTGWLRRLRSSMWRNCTELDQKINALEAETRNLQKQATYPFMGMETMSSVAEPHIDPLGVPFLQRPVQLAACCLGRAEGCQSQGHDAQPFGLRFAAAGKQWLRLLSRFVGMRKHVLQ